MKETLFVLNDQVKRCVICNRIIGKRNWNLIRKKYYKMLNQVDMYGEDSITEFQQVIYQDKVHANCARHLS
jgi:hypothetical protein